MIERIRNYVSGLFENIPVSKNSLDLQEEICSNLIDKYNDLTSQGALEEDAFSAAITSLGNIDEMLLTLRQPVIAEDPRARKKSALLVSVAIGLFIISFIPPSFAALMNLNEDIMSGDIAGQPVMAVSIAAMFVFWAAAAILLVYSFMSKPKYYPMNDTLGEQFIEWKTQKPRESLKMFGPVSAALWTATVAIYFIVSFITFKWWFTWIIFLIAACVQMIIRAVLVYRNTK